MLSLHPLGKLFWRTGCLACHCLNAVLILLAFVQTSLLILNVAQRDIPVPDLLARLATNRLGPQNLEAYWSSASFDLRGGLLLEDFSVRDTRTEQFVATLEEVRIQGSPWYLISGKGYPVREIDAMGINIFLPMSYSPSGLNEPALGIQHLSLRLKGEELFLSHLLLQTGDVHVLVRGSAPVVFLGETATGPSGSSYWKALQALKRLPQDFTASLEVEWRMLDSRRHELQARGIIPQFQTAYADMEQLDISASLLWDGESLLIPEFASSGILRQVRKDEDNGLPGFLSSVPPTRFHVSASEAAWSTDDVELPHQVRFQAAFPDPAFPFRQMGGRASMGASAPELHWRLSGDRYFASGTVVPPEGADSWSDLLQPDYLQLRAQVIRPVLADYLPGPAPDRRLVGCEADFLKLNGRYYPDSRTLRAFCQTDGFVIGQTHFARVSGDLLFNPSRLRLNDAHVRKAFDEYASGSYWQDFDSSHFSLNVEGAIYPPSLDIILGDWWINIFTNIEAPVPIPANVTVWGFWRDLQSLKHITYANGEEAYYNGVRVPRLEIRVRSNDQWAVVEELRAEFPGGGLEGTLAIGAGRKESRWRPYLLDLRSNASWEALCGASGIEELRELDFKESNPEVRIRGLLWREVVPDGGEEREKAPASLGDMDIFLQQTSGYCQVAGMRLENLSLRARYFGQTVAIEPLSGIFAEGIFTGGIYFGNWMDPPNRYRHYDLDLFAASYSEALNQFATLARDPEGIREALLGENNLGKLDLDLNLWKQSASADYEGFGYLAIRDAEIGQIHLFGGLSRLLDGMGLGFSTLDLDSMSVEWRLENQVLGIDNSLVTGPFLELALAGSINLEDRNLSLQAAVTPFRNVISMVVSPVSETLQFDLTGPLESPNWKIRFKPFRWFQNRIGVSPDAP